jgi:hypothetical protein
MGNGIFVETFGHPEIEKNRTEIGLNHCSKLQKMNRNTLVQFCVLQQSLITLFISQSYYNDVIQQQYF